MDVVLFGGNSNGVLPGFKGGRDCNFATKKYYPSSGACALTVTRSTAVATANDSNGIWYKFGANVPRLTNLGLKAEEARTNSIRTSDMTGAVVGDLQPELTTNGNFALNPIAPGQQNTVLNGWQWQIPGGTSSITWNGSSSVSMASDGVNVVNFTTGPITTIVGNVYTITFTTLTAGVNIFAGTGYSNGTITGTVLATNSGGAVVGAKVQFTATATTMFVGFQRPAGAATAVLSALSVNSAGQALNGSLALNPLNASQNTVQNGWEWTNHAGSGTVTWNGSNQVSVTGDGTNFAVFASNTLTTVIGLTYTITVDIGSNTISVGAGTTIQGNNLLSVTGSTGTGQKFQFVATTTTSFITFFKNAASTTTVANISVLSAGQLPNNWGFGTEFGIIPSVVGSSIQNGINYVDINFSGQSTSGFLTLQPDTGPPVGTYGLTYTISAFLALVGGSLTNVTNLQVYLQELPSATNDTAVTVTPTSILTRYQVSSTPAIASTANLKTVIQLNMASNQNVNATIRIGWPQLELNPLVASTVASTVTAASGTGGVNGTAVYSVGGGSCTTTPTLNVTWAAGVLTVNSVANLGSCTTFPPSPAALTFVSGTATGWTGATVTLTPTNNAAQGWATTPIPTTSAALPRNGDAMQRPITVCTSSGMFVSGIPDAPSLSVNRQYGLATYDASRNNIGFSFDRAGATGFPSYNALIASVGQGNPAIGSGIPWPVGTLGNMAASIVGSGTQTVSFNGNSFAGTLTTPSASLLTTLFVGSDSAGNENFNGFIQRFAVTPCSTVTTANLNTGTTPPSFPLPGFSIDLYFAAGKYYGTALANLSVTRAITGTGHTLDYANDSSGNWVGFGANVPRITNNGLKVEESRTDSTRNSSAQGAVAGTPGTLPTNWIVVNADGLTVNVIGTGTESGLPYVDLQLVGTSLSSQVSIRSEANNQIALTYGQTWTASIFMKLVGGSLANVNGVGVTAQSFTAGGAGTEVFNTSITGVLPTTPLGSNRFQVTGTFVNPTSVFGIARIDVYPANTAAVNLTIRIAIPQLELNPLINSTLATGAQTVTNNGTSGCTSGTYTVSGGTGTPATLTGVASLGVITTLTTLAQGSYTVFPPSPAALTGTGCSGSPTATLTPTNNAAQGFASTPIPTTSAAVTRNGDVALLNGTGGCVSNTMFGAGVPDAPTAYTLSQKITEIDDGTNNNRANTSKAAAGGGAGTQIIVGGVQGSSPVLSGVWNQSALGKIALAITTGAQAASFDSMTPATATISPVFTPTLFYIGTNGVAGNQFWNGFVTRVAYSPCANLSSGQLQAVTPLGAFN